MPSPRKSTKMEILKNIPEELVQVLFRISLVLIALNSISLILTIVYKTHTTIAILSTCISVAIAIGCYAIMKIQCRNS